MAVYKNDTVLKAFPAYNIVTRDKDSNGVINFTANDVITDSNMLNSWRFGSVVSYALESNDCPFESVEQAKGFGHELYWLNTEAICVSRTKQTIANRVLVSDDDIIRFEGKLFTVVGAPNQNKILKPYIPAE